jgi:hypothetical protein
MEPANILKIESLGNGWCDKDHVLLHACFQLLSDFVEKEMPNYPHINWHIPADTMNFAMREIQFDTGNAGKDTAAGTRDIKKEFEELHAWWQEWKRKETEGKEYSFEEQQENYLQENEMLKRLIDLRCYLWT